MNEVLFGDSSLESGEYVTSDGVSVDLSYQDVVSTNFA